MLKYTGLEDENVLVIGLAKSGYEAAKFLIKRGNEVLINDGKDESKMDKEKLNELKMLLDMDICSQDNLKECIDNARANAQMEGLGILLAYQKEKYGTVRKKFEW